MNSKIDNFLLPKELVHYDYSGWSRYFFKIFCLIWLAASISSAVTLAVFPNLSAVARSSEANNLLIKVYGCIGAPLIETSILWFCATISTQVTKNNLIASFLAALPVVLIHGINGWPKILIVFLAFIVQAYVFIGLRERITGSFAFKFIAGVHMASNLLSAVIFQSL
ncbi:MAG: hypothetical protein V4634_04920 [Pseudomonadota bacterium]